MRSDLPSGTVTFLFTDIEGSTRLLEELGAEAYAEALAEHRRVLREAFAAHGGVEVDTQGDAFFIAFPEAIAALKAAEQAQAALAAGPVRARMGVHSGEPLVTEGGYVGIDVHRGARVMSAGHGGQVLVSQATYALLDGENGLIALGRHRLKDLTEPQPLYQLGDGEFPPLKTLYTTNLPVQPTPLVGRESELAEVLELLSGSRLLTLTGAGGSGKTRLALQAAAELVDVYRDGVWWVSLAALRDPELVEPTIAQTVGAKDGLVEHLRDQETLLLLDNFEQLLEAAPGIAGLLAQAPDVRILATSRERLGLRAEQEYPVPTLISAEALALFTARARQFEPGFEPDERVAEICRRLDGLPLAVELAAARIKVLTPAQILERLEHRLDLLTAGARDAPARQRTLRATLEWSCDLLSDDEKGLFARLGVFAGSFTVEAAEAVTDAGIDTLQSLVDKSLVRRWGSGRLGMLETVREYAVERLDACREGETLRSRHADYFVGVVERTSERYSGTSELEAEHDNLRAVLSWAAAAGDGELVLRLANSLWTIFWGPRGHYAEGLSWLKKGLAAADVPTPLRLRGLSWASAAAERLGDLDQARMLAEASVALHRQEGNGAGTAHAVLILGNARFADGDEVGARSAYEEVTRLPSASRGTLASAVHNLGLLDLEGGAYDRAKSRFEEALAVQGEQGEDDDESLCALGIVALLQARYGDARSLLAKALAASSSSGHTPCVVECLIGLAGLATASGDRDRPARLLGAVESIVDEVPVRLSPTLVQLRQRTTEAVHAAETAWSEGRAWSVEAAVEYALRA